MTDNSTNHRSSGTVCNYRRKITLDDVQIYTILPYMIKKIHLRISNNTIIFTG